MDARILEAQNRVVRHGTIELAEHWLIAISGLALLLSGLFELPMAARYRITAIPGLAWSGDFITSLSVHYAASVVFIAASLFHLLYHGLARERALLPQRGDLATSIAVIKTFFGKGQEPPFGKYLPEQRLAYLGMAVIIAGLILSGLVKTWKNLYAPDLSHGLVLWATWAHNLFFVLFVLAFVAHIGAILLKPNRPLARGIFTGAIRLDYARHRHPLWMADLEEADQERMTAPAAVESEPATTEEAQPAGAPDEVQPGPAEAAPAGTREQPEAVPGEAVAGPGTAGEKGPEGPKGADPGPARPQAG
jgi:cytochrome b subunit of formate dehydrogenase